MSEKTPLVIQSPFIQGTKLQWAWDSTSLGWLKECPRKYQYHMLEGWRTKAEAVRLEFGILYHRALEHFEKYRVSWAYEESLRMVVHDLLKWTWRDGKPWRASAALDMEDKVSVLCRENLVRTVVWYIEKFRNDPAKTKVLGDGQPMVELHFLISLNRHPWDHLSEKPYKESYALCGYLDRVVSFQGEDYGMDRKSTTSTIGSYYFDRFEPDNQMTLYTIAIQAGFKTPVRGMIVDAVQIAVGFSRFQRSILFKTQEQLDEWLTDLHYWLDQAERYAAQNYWPQNDKSCQNYGGCTFRKVCSKSPSVRDRFLHTDFEKHFWNPMEPR